VLLVFRKIGDGKINLGKWGIKSWKIWDDIMEFRSAPVQICSSFAGPFTVA
jgi:hypothetical protein